METTIPKKELIKSFVKSFENQISLPDWNGVGIVDVGRMRFIKNVAIGFFLRKEFFSYKINEKESDKIKQSISKIEETKRFKDNKKAYEESETKRKQLGVSDEILNKMFIGGYEINFINMKTSEKTRISNKGSRKRIIKTIVKYIENKEMNIKKIRFSISLETIGLLN